MFSLRSTLTRAALAALLIATAAAARAQINPNQINWPTGASGCVYEPGTNTCVSLSSGFPITLGATSIAAGSTTTAVTGLSVNGVSLNAAGSSTSYLDETGNYSVPAGSGGTPCTSVASSLQYDNSGAFGCTAGITYAGTAGNLNLAATDALTGTSAGYLNEVLNGINLPSLMDQGSDHSISALAAGIAVPSSATIHQVQGLFGAVTNASTNTNAVGMYTVGICTANSTSCWGDNPTAGDSPSLTGVFLIGSEIDVGINNTSTNATGLRIDGAWVAQPTTSVGIIIARTGGSTGQWGTGIQIPSGSANIGIDLGSTAKSGAPTGSQHLRFETANGLSYSPSDIYADTNGNLVLYPFGGNTTVTGNLIVSGLGGSTLPVCPHGTGNDFTTSGCLLPLSSISAAASGTGTYDFSGATQVKLPVAAAYASAANGEVGYDSTNLNWHGWINGADNLFALIPTSGLTSGDCVEFLKTTNTWTLQDAGSACGSGGSGSTVEINGSSGLTTANFNGSTPAAGSNGINVTWQVSSSSVSAEIVGDGTSTHYLSGVGTWTAPSGGSSGALTNITGSGQITASGCTQSASSGGYCSISGSSTSAVTFSVIPGTYSSLVIEGYGQLTSGTGLNIQATFNGDTGSNYAENGYYQSNTTNPLPNGVASQTNCIVGTFSNAAVSSFEFGMFGYADTSFVKSGLTDIGSFASVSSVTNNTQRHFSCLWNNTAAITSVTLTTQSQDYVANTKFFVYGVN